MNCIDPQHIDVGPLSADDFYASSKKVCKTCRKRYTTAINKKIAERMKDGQPREVYSRKGEETPEEEAIKLRQLDQFYVRSQASYQHARLGEAELTCSDDRGVVVFLETDDFESSDSVLSLLAEKFHRLPDTTTKRF